MNRIWFVLLLCACQPQPPVSPPDHWFEIQTLATHFNEPQEMEILPNGNVLFVERGGAVKLYDAEDKEVRELAKLSVIHSQSNGLTGMAIGPDFKETRWVYVMYPAPDDTLHLQIARFVYDNSRFDLDSKQVIFRIPVEIRYGWHGEDALAFDPQGNLYISLADFTLQSDDIAGYAQIDERPGNEAHDAQRTAANSNDYRGKILRIHPEPEGSYSIPEGNLFPMDGSQGKPEIYVMGCRNPYRFSIDPKNGLLYFGDVGPDAWEEGEKGPHGYDEINVVPEAGFYGWPYFVADNKAYSDYDYATNTVGPFFDPAHPINDSPNNSGIRELPPAQPAALWYERGPSPIFPHLKQGGMNVMAGPVYYADRYPASAQKLPAYYSGKLFIYDWVRNWIRTVQFNKDLEVVSIEPFLDLHAFNKIIDIELGPDGSLYLLEYGSLGYQANTDAALRRIIYAEGRAQPDSATQQHKNVTLILPEVPGYEAGRKLIESNNCLTCHRAKGKLVGPGFRDIGMRYWNKDFITGFLPQKIIEGGSGNWEGNIIMPANPNLTMAEANQITAYILSLRFLPIDDLHPQPNQSPTHE